MSKAGSTNSTPAPPSASELLSHASHPKPFKNSSYTKTLNRRNKTLKQIVTAERDAALGITNRHKKRKNAVPGEEPLVIIRGKTKLAGAAAKAALAREAKARREFAEANGEGAEDESATATPAPPDTSMVSTGDSTMQDADVSVGPSTARATPEAAKKEIPFYFSVEAPPSLRARKRYCDVTGLAAPYTDPRTRLRYHSAEIYEIIRGFGPGVDQAYLALRGDSTSIK